VRRLPGRGAVSGLLLAGVFVAGAALRGGPVLGEFLLFGPALATTSALCAAGSLALARRAERRELLSGSADAGLQSGGKVSASRDDDDVRLEPPAQGAV